jgi:hypothetical protein
MPVNNKVRSLATFSPTHHPHSMQIQTLMPRLKMSTPQGFKKRPQMTEASVRKDFFCGRFNEKIDIEYAYSRCH